MNYKMKKKVVRRRSYFIFFYQYTNKKKTWKLKEICDENSQNHPNQIRVRREKKLKNITIHCKKLEAKWLTIIVSGFCSRKMSGQSVKGEKD